MQKLKYNESKYMYDFNLLNIKIAKQNKKKKKKKRKVYFPYLDALGGEVNGKINSDAASLGFFTLFP